MQWKIAATLAAAVVGWHGLASAQGSYPDKPVRIVVPFAPGGSFDLIARDLSAKLAAAWGQAVIIDNRGGAGGNIGAQAVIGAAPDGYTLLFWGDGVLANPLLYDKPPFDAIRDLSGIALVATAPQVLVSRPGTGPSTMKDVLAATQPLNYGTAGNGSPGHLAAELMKREGAKQLTHIPYKGGTQALTDLIGGQIQLVSTGLPACIAFIRSGRLQAVAVSSKTRLKNLPNVPAVSETLPGYEVDTWFGMMAPKATPEAIRNKVAADLRKVMADPELQKKLIDGGFVPTISTPTELDAKMIKDLAFWRAQVAKSGARAE
ncbi:exported protein [Pigmentiphaga litoralis]|uniref:Bug family tripartite tricarboxylate transporter substrate binding protein n=1 Tax=Pigmentiphaga litoralis TaxID=516702 RepID=UPI0016798387|nr:tripartite tricarboxylate transporter substrate binding protein [Pigmentiphaga litoralis]GGX15251.1 exported protein [Pigmentiphaga litoralis]